MGLVRMLYAAVYYSAQFISQRIDWCCANRRRAWTTLLTFVVIWLSYCGIAMYFKYGINQFLVILACVVTNYFFFRAMESKK